MLECESKIRSTERVQMWKEVSVHGKWGQEGGSKAEGESEEEGTHKRAFQRYFTACTQHVIAVGKKCFVASLPQRMVEI